MPNVSVIIPVYNAEPYIRQCLESVQNQTLQDIEIICVDDGSTDQSLEILREFEKKDPRIQVFCQKNLFAGVARNTGIAAATGEYLAFLDSDDYYELDGLERLYDIAKANDLDMVKCSTYLLNMKTGVLDTNDHFSNAKFPAKDTLVSFETEKDLLRVADAAWNGLYKTSFIKDQAIQFNSLRCINDHSFFIDCVIQAKRVMIVDGFLTYYRTNMSNSLVGIRYKHFYCQIQSYQIIRDLLIKHNVDTDSRIRILRSELNQVFVWYEKFLAAGVNVMEVEDIIAAFVASYDASDVGLDYLGKFMYRHIFERMQRRNKIHYRQTSAADSDIKVSVIIPVFNSVPFLSECLESVLLQSCQDFEIICIDDGSEDASLEMLSEYAQRDSRIILLQQQRGFAGAARNMAIPYAKGEYIAFVDSDDVIEPEFLAELYQEGKRTNADVVVSYCVSWNGKYGKSTMGSWIARKRLTKQRPFCYLDSPDYILNFTSGGPGAKMFRTSFVREKSLKFLPLRRSEDFNFVLGGIVMADRVTEIEVAKYLYRRNNVNSSESTKDEAPLMFWDATMQFKETLIRTGRFEEIKRAWLNNALQRIAVNLRHIKTAAGYEQIFNLVKEVQNSELELDRQEKNFFFEADDYATITRMVQYDTCLDYFFAENKRLKEASLQSKELVILRKELDQVKKSSAYKLSQLLTFPLRKVKGGIQCIQDHGFIYTVRLFKKKLSHFLQKKK